MNLLCMIFFHKLRILREIRSTKGSGEWVCAVQCTRCEHKFMFSEARKAFVRYDDDPTFRRMMEELAYKKDGLERLP